MTKLYEDGNKLTLWTEIKLPIPDNFFAQWRYQTSGLSDLNTNLGLGQSGNIYMLMRRPAESEYIMPHEVVNFSNGDDEYSVSLFPSFKGTGKDALGEFKLFGHSHITGKKLSLSGIKTYKDPVTKKQQSYKISMTLPYPTLSMSGEWKIEDMNKGITTKSQVTMERTAKYCFGPEENIMTLRIDQTTKLTLTTADMVWLPVVSGTGYSELGEYTISGDFDPETGDGNYDLTFNWGKCHLNTRPTSGVGVDMMGYADIDCTNKGYNQNEVIWTSTTRVFASENKFAIEERPGTVNYKRSDGRNIVQNGVFGYFPKFSGHGKDGKFGKYTIKMAKNTSLSGNNRYSVVYDNGVVDYYNCHLTLGKDGAYHCKGTFLSSPTNRQGTFTSEGSIQTDNISGYCLADGATQPASWLWSWPERKNCPYPSDPAVNCVATFNICDSWVKHEQERITHNVVTTNKKYGFAMKIAVPEEYWTSKGWTVAIRFPAGQKKLSVNAWNAAFLDVYETSRETVVVMTARSYLNSDKTDPYSFMVTVNGLHSHAKPSMLFWPERNRNGFCYNQPLTQFARSSAGRAGNEFQQLLKQSEKSSDAVSKIVFGKGHVIKIL